MIFFYFANVVLYEILAVLFNVGWQYQTSTPTVQCLLEEALIRITKLERDHLCLVGAGRTDAGVHAWGQVSYLIHRTLVCKIIV